MASLRKELASKATLCHLQGSASCMNKGDSQELAAE